MVHGVPSGLKTRSASLEVYIPVRVLRIYFHQATMLVDFLHSMKKPPVCSKHRWWYGMFNSAFYRPITFYETSQETVHHTKIHRSLQILQNVRKTRKKEFSVSLKQITVVLFVKKLCVLWHFKVCFLVYLMILYQVQRLYRIYKRHVGLCRGECQIWSPL